jgi:hypothetical protein
MMDACARAGARLMVVEIADGVLQPETQMLLESEEIRERVRGVVVAGNCAASLLFATEYVRNAGLDVWTASGVVTNSPLFMREFSSRSGVPLALSRGRGSRLARIIRERMAADDPEAAQSHGPAQTTSCGKDEPASTRKAWAAE